MTHTDPLQAFCFTIQLTLKHTSNESINGTDLAQ